MLQAYYVIVERLTLLLVFNKLVLERQGRGFGQAWLTAMPSGRLPALTGLRQRSRRLSAVVLGAWRPRQGSSPNGRDPQGLGALSA
jgi:hypothetical protein